MNILRPWNAVFFVGLVVYFGIRHVFIERTKAEKKVVRRMDSLEKALLKETSGDGYRRNAEKTGRLAPWIGKMR